jgi:ribose transport system permease protein
MVAVVKLPAFIATYGMMWVASGFAVVLLKGHVIYGFKEDFRFLGVGNRWGSHADHHHGDPVDTRVSSHAADDLWPITLRGGRKPGGSPPLRRKEGSDAHLAYTLSGLLAAAAGLVYVARLNASEAGIGANMLLPTIAAVVIGGTSLFGGEGGIVGTLIGALIMTIVQNGMNLLGVESVWQGVVLGALIVVAVLLDQWARKTLAGE